VGQSYSQLNVGGGGITPYNYSVASGALPTGTTLDPKSGVVSGTPTVAGNFSYTIQMTDSTSPVQAVSNVVSGKIVSAPLTMTSAVSAMTQVGQPYSQTNVGSGGTAPYTYSVAGALPDGTTLNASTGTVSGAPRMAGAFSYTINITESCGCGWSQTTRAVVTGTIAPPLLAITPTASTTIEVGQPYLQTNVASGGTAPYTYSVPSGSTLPPGTTLDTKTGTVSGTPTTAGAFSYTIQVTDSGDPVRTATTPPVTGTILPPKLTIIWRPSATTRVGQSYSQTNVASGGTPPYKYSVAKDGTLPAGTTLDTSTGTVSGTASAAGAFTYTIEAKDSGNPVQTAPTVPPVRGTIAATQCCASASPPPTPLGCQAAHSKHRSPPCLEHRARREHLSYSIKKADGGSRRGAGRRRGTGSAYSPPPNMRFTQALTQAS
jgi:large repetitive protein